MRIPLVFLFALLVWKAGADAGFRVGGGGGGGGGGAQRAEGRKRERGRRPLPLQLGGMGERCKLPHWGLGLRPRNFASSAL